MRGIPTSSARSEEPGSRPGRLNAVHASPAPASDSKRGTNAMTSTNGPAATRRSPRRLGVLTATCDVRFSLQNRYAGQRLTRALARLGVSNGAVTISGRATRSEKEISEAEFVGADAAAIRTTLTGFLTEHEVPRADDLVILDMEPQGFAPRNLGEFEGQQQRDLIAAYRRR